MYKSNYDGGLSKKDVKRIQEIVDQIHAKAMKEDLKDAKYVEGYAAGQRNLIPFIEEIMVKVPYDTEAYALLEDLIEYIEEM